MSVLSAFFGKSSGRHDGIMSGALSVGGKSSASGNSNSNALVIQDLWQQLLADSPFLAQAKIRATGRFEKEDFELGTILRRGEFSPVYEVLTLPDEEERVSNEDSSEETTSNNNEEDPFPMDASKMGQSSARYVAAARRQRRRARASNLNSHAEKTATNTASPSNRHVAPGRRKSDTRALGDNDCRDERERRQRQLVCNSSAMYHVKLLQPPRKFGGGGKLGYCQAAVNLLAEIQYSRQLQHHNICKARGLPAEDILSSLLVVDAGEQQHMPPRIDRLFLLTDMIVETLEERMVRWRHNQNNPQDGTISTNSNSNLLKKLKFAKDMAGALCYLHERHIMALHLAPSNIGFLEDGTLQLFDLGTCREEGDENHDSSDANNNMGSIDASHEISLRRAPVTTQDGMMGVNKVQPTPNGCVPRYQAPELVTSLQPASCKADVYSCAMIVFEMITLCIPYDGMKTGQHLVKVCMEGKRPTLNNRDVPHRKSIEAILHNGWRHNPTRRWAMSKMRKAIRNVAVDVASTKQAEREQREYVRTLEHQSVKPDPNVREDPKIPESETHANVMAAIGTLANEGGDNTQQSYQVQGNHVVPEHSAVATTTAPATTTLHEDDAPQKSRTDSHTKSCLSPEKAKRKGRQQCASSGDGIKHVRAKEPTNSPRGATSPMNPKPRGGRARSNTKKSRRGNSVTRLATEPLSTAEPTTPKKKSLRGNSGPRHPSSAPSAGTSHPTSPRRGHHPTSRQNTTKARKRGGSAPRMPADLSLATDAMTPQRQRQAVTASSNSNVNCSKAKITPTSSGDNIGQNLPQRQGNADPPAPSKKPRRTSLGAAVRSPSPARRTAAHAPRSLLALVTPKLTLKKKVQLRREACLKNPDF